MGSSGIQGEEGMKEYKRQAKRIDLRGKSLPMTIIILAREAKSLKPKSSLLILTDDRDTVEQAREWGERVSWAHVTSQRKEGYWVLQVLRL